MRLTKIKLKRLESGLRQVELAQRAQIARCRLSELENGYLTPKPEEQTRLAHALGVPAAELSERAEAAA